MVENTVQEVLDNAKLLNQSHLNIKAQGTLHKTTLEGHTTLVYHSHVIQLVNKHGGKRCMKQ